VNRAKPATKDLRDAGIALWHKLTREFVFNSAELALAHQLCTTIDEIAAMKADLNEMGTVVAGSSKQPRPNPLLDKLVQHRKLADRLVVALGLPAEGEAVGRRRSAQAKQAADARWRKPKSRGRIHSVAAIQTNRGR
jgi:hypothetical protein